MRRKHTKFTDSIWGILQEASLVAQSVKYLPAVQETRVRSLGWEDPLEEEMANHSSILAWKISWTEEPGGLQSMGSQRVGHDWETNTYRRQKQNFPIFMWKLCNYFINNMSFGVINTTLTFSNYRTLTIKLSIMKLQDKFL